MNAIPLTQEQRQRYIWKCKTLCVGHLRIDAQRYPSQRYPRYHTISELYNIVHGLIRNSAPENMLTHVVISLNVRPNNQELEVLAQCCQCLGGHLDNLYLCRFTDDEAYRMLQSLSRSSLKIGLLSVSVGDGETLTTTIPLLRDVLLHTCCQDLFIEYVRFTSDDCHILGQVLANKELVVERLNLWNCSFPSLDDVWTILGGCFVGKTSWRLNRCVQRNETITPNSGTEDVYSEFRRIASAVYQRDRTTAGDCNHYRYEAARTLSDYVEPLRDAGFSYLLIPSQHAGIGSSGNGARLSRSLEEWVEVFSNSAVNDRVDVLVHILSSDPRACVKAASLRQKKQNASVTLQCWTRCNTAKKQFKTRQGEKSRP